MQSLRCARLFSRHRSIATKINSQRRAYAEAVTDKIKLSLALPHQSIFKSHDVVQVNIPAISGEMGVLAKHVPSIEQLKPGLVEVIEESNGSKKFFRKRFIPRYNFDLKLKEAALVSGGFAVVQPDSQLSINAVEGYPLEDFSVENVNSQLAEAQKIASGNESENDVIEAKIQVEMESTDLPARIDQSSPTSSNLDYIHAQHPKKNLGIVPRGTVASRVQHLQGITNKKLSEIRSHIRNHTRENSSSRFGRQDSKNSSQPAQNKAKPNKDPHHGTKHYSLFDSSNLRNRHNDQKANPSSSSRKQLESSEIGMDVNVLVSSIKTQSKNLSATLKIPTRDVLPCVEPYDKTRDLSVNLKKTDRVKSQLLPVLNCSVANSDLSKDHIDRTTNEYKSEPRSNGSDRSISTTSTVRRQSVRDLFDKHGVERPPGLASSAEPRISVDFSKQGSYKYCHICSCINKSDSSTCLRCKHFFCSRCRVAQNGKFKASTEMVPENFSSETPEKSFIPLDSESFIRKSQRSRQNLTQSNKFHDDRQLKPRSSSNFSMQSSPSESLHKPNFGIPKKSIETRKSAPFLSGRNVTTNVKNSPFLAGEIKEPYDVSYSKAGLEINDNHGHPPLRHYTSCPKVYQKQSVLERKNSSIYKESYSSNKIELQVNPLSEVMPFQGSFVRRSTMSKPKFQIPKTTIEDSNKNTTDGRYSPTDLLPLLREDVETDLSVTTEQNLHETNLWSRTEAFPAKFESTDSLGVLSKAKSKSIKYDNGRSRTGSTSSSRTKVFDNYTKNIPSSYSPGTNDQQAMKLDRRVFKSPSSVLVERIGTPMTRSLNDPRSYVDQTVSKRGTINTPILPSTSSHNNMEDLQCKKQRRLVIANKIKQGLPEDLNNQRRQKLHPNLPSTNSGALTGDKIHPYIVIETRNNGALGITEDYVSSDTTAANTGLSVATPQISPRLHGDYAYKRSSYVNNDDIPIVTPITMPRNNRQSHDGNVIGISSNDLPSVIGQDIRGVTVTLQLEGTEELIFRAERLFDVKN